MRLKTKIKRHNFAFTERTDCLLRKIQEETELNFTVIIKQAIELLAKEKGIFL
jgi:transcription antitermination factor NusA-like protein